MRCRGDFEMKHIGFIIFVVMVLCGFSGPSFAQNLPIKNTETIETRYVVTDDAVFVYYRKDQEMPYKLYDFSTQHVYVYFSNRYGENFAVHEFAKLNNAELLYVKKRACGSSGLSGAFQRFCK